MCCLLMIIFLKSFYLIYRRTILVKTKKEHLMLKTTIAIR